MANMLVRQAPITPVTLSDLMVINDPTLLPIKLARFELDYDTSWACNLDCLLLAALFPLPSINIGHLTRAFIRQTHQTTLDTSPSLVHLSE